MRYVWTDDEEATLRRLAGKMSRSKIATILGRSEQSVKAKAVKLGLSLDYGRTHWTQERLADMSKLRSAGMQWGEVAKRLGASLVSCQKAYSRAVCAQRTRAMSQFDAAVVALGEVLAAHPLTDELRGDILRGFAARRDLFVQQTRTLETHEGDIDAES
jgi:hypothetical protein